MELWLSEKFAKIGSCFRKIPEVKPTKDIITALELARQNKISEGEIQCSETKEYIQQ